MTTSAKLLCKKKNRWLYLADLTRELVHILKKRVSREESCEFLGHDTELNWV